MPIQRCDGDATFGWCGNMQMQLQLRLLVLKHEEEKLLVLPLPLPLRESGRKERRVRPWRFHRDLELTLTLCSAERRGISRHDIPCHAMLCHALFQR